MYDFDPEQNRPAPVSEATLAVAGEGLGNEVTQSGALAEAGEGLKVGQLTPIAAMLSRRMEHEVLHPMDQWLKLHAVRPPPPCAAGPVLAMLACLVAALSQQV